jgi:cytochrome c5
MLHFSCDLCGTSLSPTDDPRFVLKMEAYPAAVAAGLDDADTDPDPVEEMALLLQEAEDAGEDLPEPAAKKFRFDLCSACHRKFVANPLGRGKATNLRFSGN